MLWADDLVLLALNKDSLQVLLNQLREFCHNWGLVVNMTKTEVMIFNSSGKILKESKTLKYGDINIKSTSEYTYLGITITLTGTYNLAVTNLRKKALRGYFGLRSIIDWRYLKTSSMIKLFDSLIKPILTYGCQVWLPYLSKRELDKLYASEAISQDVTNAFSKTTYETTHLAILKWIIGVNKKTSNQTIWGDTARVPLSLTLIKQVLEYFSRITNDNNSDSIVHNAVKEQQALNLPWYTTLLELWNHEEEHDDSAVPNSKKRQEKYLSQEKYLQLTQKRNQGRAADLAKLRMSAHKLKIETGRYKNKPVETRICHLCTTSDEDTVDAFLQIPFLELFVESEQHLLRECPYYEDIRRSLPESIRSKGDNFKSLLTDDSYVLHTARYVSNLFKRRDKGIKERGDIIL